MKHSIIFDYDGTIHDTMNIYEPAMREAFRWLKESCSIEIPPVSSQRIASWLGMNKYEMWNSFLPDLPGELREKASDMVGAYMEEAVLTGKAVWYDGIGKTLEEMKRRGYSMAVLSNCQTSYARVHWQQFSMDRWFERFYDCESFAYLPKTEIIGTANVNLQSLGRFVPSTANWLIDAAPYQHHNLRQSVNVTSLPFFSFNVPKNTPALSARIITFFPIIILYI